jgi:large subunit ribosomal protein L7Ae
MSSAKKPVVAAKPASKVAAKPAAKPAASKKPAGKASSFHAQHAHLFPKAPRNYGIGRVVRPKTDLSRYVKWPKYIRLQRQRAVLKKRLKVPPAINQFTKALDKNQAATLFRLLAHYRPESREEKKLRLKSAAEAEVKDAKKAAEPKATQKPIFVKYGLNHVTTLIESKKAKLVVIAHDVDPIELVVWLPALCRKMNVPYVIIKGKARLGHIVHKKTVSALALTEIRKEDAPKLEQFVQNANIQFKDNVSDRKKWGGGHVGIKATHVIRKREKAAARETKA